MKSKMMALLMALTVSCSLVAFAQKKNDNSPRQPQQQPPVMQVPGPGTKVMLSCSPGQGKDVSTPLYVKNMTATDVPANTMIFWTAQKQGTVNGKQLITEMLKKNGGNQVSLLGPPDNLASCQAWYFKK